jgi:hypothetical protein
MGEKSQHHHPTPWTARLGEVERGGGVLPCSPGDMLNNNVNCAYTIIKNTYIFIENPRNKKAVSILLASMLKR